MGAEKSKASWRQKRISPPLNQNHSGHCPQSQFPVLLQYNVAFTGNSNVSASTDLSDEQTFETVVVNDFGKILK